MATYPAHPGRVLRIDTDGLTVEETADAIAARTGWARPAE